MRYVVTASADVTTRHYLLTATGIFKQGFFPPNNTCLPKYFGTRKPLIQLNGHSNQQNIYCRIQIARSTQEMHNFWKGYQITGLTNIPSHEPTILTLFTYFQVSLIVALLSLAGVVPSRLEPDSQITFDPCFLMYLYWNFVFAGTVTVPFQVG